MSATWILTMTFIATTMVVVALMSTINDLFLRYRTLLNERLEALAEPAGQLSHQGSLYEARARSSNGTIGELWRLRLKDYCEQAGLKISLKSICGIAVGAGGLLAAMAIATTAKWWTAPLGFTLGVGVIVAYVVVRRRARMRKFISQLPHALDVIGRAVRAGQTVSAAFQMVANDLKPPLSVEFRDCYDEQRLGLPYETALRNLAQRTGIMELRILAVGLIVQSQSGGSLADLLGNLSTTIKKRLKLAHRVKALTGEGRMQAAVLMVLPAAALGLLLVVAPDYVAVLFERPWLLVATFSAQVLGAIWIRRNIQFEY